MRPRSRIPTEIRRIRKAATGDAQKLKVADLKARAREFEPITIQEADKKFRAWFQRQGWRPLQFQEQAWQAYRTGKSGLISVPTGSGKTYAAFGGPFIELLSQPLNEGQSPLTILYISPLKALVRDVAKALARPIEELKLPFTVEVRTGDSTQDERARLRQRLPNILVTTPESLALILTQKDWRENLGGVRSIILDEWHELIGSKRGSLLELTLARLKSAAQDAKVWAVSATLANLNEAAQVATGSWEPTIIREEINRPVEVKSILPETVSNFPWFGHSGLKMAKLVSEQIDISHSTLLFTNTRSQAERWYQELKQLKPEWNQILALHHGSLDRKERERVEEGVKDGSLRVVVATSSLDLGVDFPAVEKVIQIGSTKGLARALQRAGRAFHRPGEPTALSICPTHLLEIVEISALREGLRCGVLEARHANKMPIDVLVQFILNCSFNEGVSREEIIKYCQSTDSFRDVTQDVFDWAFAFLSRGGVSLQAYLQFQKIEEVEGKFRFASPRLARLHRMNIGTIMSSEGVLVRFQAGAKLGMIDEAFIAKLKPGDTFQFSGRTLELLRMRDMTATVRLSQVKEINSPVWSGTLLPISPVLSSFLRDEIAKLSTHLSNENPELTAFAPAAHTQKRLSHLPLANQLLIESFKDREGHHLFVYPWEGRAIHEGLGHLLAYRLAQIKPNTISVSANDHGFELLGAESLGTPEEIQNALLQTWKLEEDIRASLNFTELQKRAFREVARVAGLIQQGLPGERKALRQLQISSSILFDVFRRYEPEHPLLKQAEREVRDSQLQVDRLLKLIENFSNLKFIFKELPFLTPFAFPLYLERIRSRLSTEKLEDRIARIQSRLLAVT